MKRYVKRRLPSPTSYELHKLAEYLITRPDLSDGSIEQVELALKKAGKVTAHEDHFYTTMHAISRTNWEAYRRPKAIARNARALAYLFADEGVAREARCVGFKREDYLAVDRLAPSLWAIHDMLDREILDLEYGRPICDRHGFTASFLEFWLNRVCDDEGEIQFACIVTGA